MRKNFAQVLKDGKVYIEKEYTRLYNLLYGIYDDNLKGISLHDLFSRYFPSMWFRGTALTLEEFDEERGFFFEAQPQNFNIDYLVTFCEYFYNITYGFMGANPCLHQNYLQFVIKQIELVISAIGYMATHQDGFTIFVEKSQSAIAVSEIIEDKNLSYKTIYYNHHSMQGNIDGKREILLKYANLLEAKRKMLHNINPGLENDIFCLFNSLNIRHNNVEKTDKNYIKYVSEMSSDQIEEWYDELYQMCLLAFLELEHKERKSKIKILRENIEPTK